MYNDYWDFSGLPFQIYPDGKFYFSSKTLVDSVKRILYALKSLRGIVLLTGEVGCGKTTITRVIMERLREAEYGVALISHPTMSDSFELLKEVLYQFGLKTETLVEKQAMIHLFYEWLALRYAPKNKHTVLIVDEAHLIQNTAIFEELRLLSNFQDNKDNVLLTLMFVGQPELKKYIQEARALESRIGLKCHLAPFSPTETRAYIYHRLNLVGGKGEIFDDEVIQEIFRLSGGVPREINKLCDTLLFEAYLMGKKTILPDFFRTIFHTEEPTIKAQADSLGRQPQIEPQKSDQTQDSQLKVFLSEDVQPKVDRPEDTQLKVDQFGNSRPRTDRAYDPKPEPELKPDLEADQPELGADQPEPEPELKPELEANQPEPGADQPEPELKPELEADQPEPEPELKLKSDLGADQPGQFPQPEEPPRIEKVIFFQGCESLIREKGDLYFLCWQKIKECLDLIIENKQINLMILDAVAEALIKSLAKNDELLNTLFVQEESPDLVTHLVNVAMIAAKIGLCLEYKQSEFTAIWQQETVEINPDRSESGQQVTKPENDLRELVLSALLHDVGMIKVPLDILLEKGRLTSEQMKEIRLHPLHSDKILKAIDKLPSQLALVAYQEHEREDGTGYPHGLKGSNIHEYAKIVGLADTYIAMLQPRSQGQKRAPYEIVKEIIKTEKNRFPTQLIRALINELSFFPVGLYVNLNTGEFGRVKRINKLAPTRPVIEILKDAANQDLPSPKEINLMKEYLIRIEKFFYKPE